MVSIEKGIIENLDSGRKYQCEAIPAHLMTMLNDGGLLGNPARRRCSG